MAYFLGTPCQHLIVFVEEYLNHRAHVMGALLFLLPTLALATPTNGRQIERIGQACFEGFSDQSYGSELTRNIFFNPFWNEPRVFSKEYLSNFQENVSEIGGLSSDAYTFKSDDMANRLSPRVIASLIERFVSFSEIYDRHRSFEEWSLFFDDTNIWGNVVRNIDFNLAVKKTLANLSKYSSIGMYGDIRKEVIGFQ
jgi:hypothetical protein